MPKVTVLMPVRNAEKYVRAAVESILVQTWADFELLVIDDASTDGSRAILESFDDKRIRVLENAQSRGLTETLNVGIAASDSDYVARQDADDLSCPDRLGRQTAMLDDHNSVALVGSAYTRIDEHGSQFAVRSVPQETTSIRWRLLYLNAFPHTSAMIRRGALDNVGSYDESFQYAQDYELWSRIADAYEVAALPETLVAYRSSPESMTSTYPDAGAEADAISAANIKRMLDAAQVPPDRRPPVDRDAVSKLNFGDYAALDPRQAKRAAADALTLQRPFGAVNCTAAAARKHRRKVGRTLSRRLARLAHTRRDPGLYVEAARVFGRSLS